MARFFKQFAVVGAVWLVSLPVYSLVATTIPSWHRLKTISALMSTTNFATLAAIGWLTLPSRAPTPPPPPGPPPPTDEGGPAAGSHRAAPSLDETSRRRGSGRAIVPTNPPAQQRRPSWGSNLSLVPGQCAPPARPPAPFPADRVTGCDALSLHLSRQSSHTRPFAARAHRARAAHHTRAPPLAQATPREMYGCGQRRCSTTARRRAGGRRTRCRRYNRGRPAPSIRTRVRQRPRRRSVSTLQRAPPPTYRRRRWYCRRRRRPMRAPAPRRAAATRPAGGSTRRRAPSLARSRCPPETRVS